MSFLRSLLAPRASITDVTDPSAFMTYGGYGRRTTAGESVSPASALTLSSWFACIRNISEDVGKLPFEIFERQAGGGKTRATQHPLHRLLKTRPNPDMSSQTFRETLTGWALGWGNGYAEIERDGAGDPVALWPIHPWRMRVRRIDGVIVYDVWSPEYAGGTTVRLAPKDVFHLRGFGDDALCGLSIARLAAETIGLALAAQTFGAAFFGNGATLGVLLEHPGTLSADAQVRLRETWAKIHAGADNSHKLAILEEGMKASRTSVPPDEAQFIESRAFEIHEVARFFRMPVHKIQMMDRATFSNIEQQSIEYVVDCLQPWLTRWEQEGERKLLDQRDLDRYLIEHNIIVLMRGDSTARSNYYRTMISTGVMTPNEAREMESMNPVAGDASGKLFMQGAMSTLERIVAGPPPAPPAAPAPGAPGADGDGADKEDQADANKDMKQQSAIMLPVFADAEARCRRKEEMAILNALRKHETQAAFAPWAAEFYAAHSAYLVDAFSPGVVAFANAILATRPAYSAGARDADLMQCCQDYCANARRHVTATGKPFKPDQPLAETILGILTREVSHA